MEKLTVGAFIAFTITTVITLVVDWLLVRHIFSEQKKLEIEKRRAEKDFELRQKSEIVAELFAIWEQTSSSSKSYKQIIADDFKRLNQLSFECGLWLPADILFELSERLANKPGAKDLKEILVDVRYHLNPEAPKIDWTKIIHW